jgi:integrase
MEMQRFKAPNPTHESIRTTGLSTEWFQMTLDKKPGPRGQSKAPPANTRSLETTSRTHPRPPKRLDQLRESLRARHYSRRTEKTYSQWTKRFIYFHNLRHPSEMAEAEVNAFLTSLAVQGKVSASTQNQALSALLFLYRYVIGRELGALGEVIRARKPKRLPVVMTRDEVKAVMAQLDGDRRLMAALIYGGSLRLMECLRLRIQDIDFSRNEILVRDGKGSKDRITMLPESLKSPLTVILIRSSNCTAAI